MSSGPDENLLGVAADPQDLLATAEAGRRYLRGISFRSVAYTSSLLFGATAVPFIIRHLGAVRWGHYTTVTSLLFIAVAITEGGLSSMGVREFSSEGRHDRREYMRSLIGLRLVLSTLAAAGSIAFALVAGFDRVMVEGTAIGCVGLFGSNIQATLGVVLTSRLRMGWLAVMDFISQTASAGWMIALVLLGAPLLPFSAATTIAAAIILVITVVLVRDEVSLRPAFDPARWRALASESFVYAAATALGVVYAQIVVVATDLLTSKLQTGYFGLGFRVLSVVNGLPWLVVGAAFPILTRAAASDATRLRHALGRLSEVGLIAGGTLSVGMVIGAPFIVTVVGGHGFASSVDVLRILGAGIPATFLVATWSYALLSLRVYRRLVLANGLAVAVAIALCVILIPSLGARGSAVVTSSLEVILSSIYALVLRRVGEPAALDPKRIARIVLAFAAAYAAGLFVPGPSVVRTVCALAVLGVAILSLRLFPEELLQAVRSGR